MYLCECIQSDTMRLLLFRRDGNRLLTLGFTSAPELKCGFLCVLFDRFRDPAYIRAPAASNALSFSSFFFSFSQSLIHITLLKCHLYFRRN